MRKKTITNIFAASPIALARRNSGYLNKTKQKILDLFAVGVFQI